MFWHCFGPWGRDVKHQVQSTLADMFFEWNKIWFTVIVSFLTWPIFIWYLVNIVLWCSSVFHCFQLFKADLWSKSIGFWVALASSWSAEIGRTNGLFVGMVGVFHILNQAYQHIRTGNLLRKGLKYKYTFEIWMYDIWFTCAFLDYHSGNYLEQYTW